MSETKKFVPTVKAKVELKIGYYNIPEPRKDGEHTIGTNKKGNGALKAIFPVQEALPLAELNKRLDSAVDILNNGSKANEMDKNQLKVLKAGIVAPIIADYKEKISKITDAHKKEVEKLKAEIRSLGVDLKNSKIKLTTEDADPGQPIKPTKK